MVVISMSSMSPKVIGRKVCLRTKGPSKLLKDPEPKRHPNIWRKDEFFKIRDFMKVKDRGVHHKKYNGCCIKQWIEIPKAI